MEGAAASILKPAEFEQLLKEHDGQTVVGKTRRQSATAADVMRALKEWTRVPIEEQDHSWYIVHFPEWVMVAEDSRLFERFCQSHAAFLENWAKERRKGEETV